MPGASLAIELNELSIIVANDRGYSLNPKNWNDKQKYIIDQVVASGVSQVYSPPPVDGEKIAPDWTFLKPITEVSLPSGVNRIKMPDDFGSIDGPIAIKSDANTVQPWWIMWRNENYILQLAGTSPAMIGPPKFAAECVFRDINPPSGQVRGLLFFPTPDRDYTLQVKYSITPERLSGAQPYPYGGPRYRELFIASCLAISEQRYDNVMGVMTKKFNQMLLAAVSEDNKNRPQQLGYNANVESQAWRGFQRPAPLAFYYNDEPLT